MCGGIKLVCKTLQEVGNEWMHACCIRVLFHDDMHGSTRCRMDGRMLWSIRSVDQRSFIDGSSVRSHISHLTSHTSISSPRQILVLTPRRTVPYHPGDSRGHPDHTSSRPVWLDSWAESVSPSSPCQAPNGVKVGSHIGVSTSAGETLSTGTGLCT